MLTGELCTILEVTVRNEDRYVVHPSVTWGCGKQYPTVSRSNFVERLDPGSATHQALLVEDEEGILDPLVLADVVPAIHDHLDAGGTELWVHGDTHLDGLVLPVKIVTLLCGSDHV